MVGEVGQEVVTIYTSQGARHAQLQCYHNGMYNSLCTFVARVIDRELEIPPPPPLHSGILPLPDWSPSGRSESTYFIMTGGVDFAPPYFDLNQVPKKHDRSQT